MSDTLASQADAQRPWQLTLQRWLKAFAVVAAAFSKKAGHLTLLALRKGAVASRYAASKTAAFAAANRPVRYAKHLRILQQLGRLEREAIASMRSIECREKRTRAILSLARTAYEIGRDTEPFLKATLEELRVEQYWLRKQNRIFAAAQLACSVAGLAARSNQEQIGRDAYLCGQMYNGKVESVDRKIGLAVVFADVACLLGAGYDQVSWLTTAMELACSIAEATDRFGAVSFVARKMVTDQVPPCDNQVVDKRFAVDVSAMAKITVIKAAEKPVEAGADLEFKLTA